MNKNISAGLLMLRLSIGVLFLMHGIAKIQHGTGFIEKTFADSGIPSALASLVYLGEVIAPILLIIGFRTRLAAFIIMGTVAVIVFTTAMNKFWQLTAVGAWALELQALFFFGALALFFTGGGNYAVSVRNKWD